MLTPDSISALLRAGESETLELAPSFGPDVIETAVAFANTYGGAVLSALPPGQEEWARATPHPPTSQIGTQPRRGKRQQLSMKKQATPVGQRSPGCMLSSAHRIFIDQIGLQRLSSKREKL